MSRVESRDRLALALAVVSAVAIPLSYSWVLLPGEDPGWLGAILAIAEWGGLAAAFGAIWLSLRSRSRPSVWANRLAVGSLFFYLAALLAVAALYRP